MDKVTKYSWKRGILIYLLGLLSVFGVIHILNQFISPIFINRLVDSMQLDPYYNDSIMTNFNESESAVALRDLNVRVVKSYFVRDGDVCREELVHVVGLDKGNFFLKYDSLEKYNAFAKIDATEFKLSYDDAPNTIAECPQSIELRLHSGRYHLYLSRSNDTGTDAPYSDIEPEMLMKFVSKLSQVTMNANKAMADYSEKISTISDSENR